MNRNDRFAKPNVEELFATAASRLEAGESIPDILASFPPASHDELLEMLAIVEVTDQMRKLPVPRPSATRRAAAKRAFLATAAEMRAEQLAQPSQPQIAAPQPLSRPAARRAARRRMNPWERFMAGLQDIFGSGAVRLAPIVLTLVVVLFGTTTLVSLAQEAVPGDAIYTLKQFTRKLELGLTPASQRDQVRLEQEQELAEDVAKAANRADVNSAIIQAEDTLIYYGRNNRLLEVGGLTVMDRYQPDANGETFTEMTIEGDLQPGSQVELTYQILPGQSDMVQGIALTVVAPPSEVEVTEVDVPASEPTQASTCNVSQPEGWVSYTVSSGDNLTFLANRGGTSVDKLMEVNCLDSQDLLIGESLYVPADSLKTDIPLLQCGTPVPNDWTLYEVQRGDNLSLLAERSGVSVADVMGVNCLNEETIVIGAKLYLPESAATE